MVLLRALILTSAIQTIIANFPFDSSTAELLLTDEYPTCGLFTSNNARIFNGDDPYKQQFPWATCILKLFYDYAHHFFQKDGQWMYVKNENISPHPRTVDFNSVPKLGVIPTPYWTQHCTGTIIHQNWVITAAHCFE